MAYTATLIKQSIMGNERSALYNVTADAASGVVGTSFGLVDAVVMGPISMATASPKVRINTNILSAASNGNIFISSAASGDNFFVIVYGRS